MAKWWQPTMGGYLGRVSKALICGAVIEAKARRRPTTSPHSRKATWPTAPPKGHRLRPCTEPVIARSGNLAG
jgi:hypothetical protein